MCLIIEGLYGARRNLKTHNLKLIVPQFFHHQIQVFLQKSQAGENSKWNGDASKIFIRMKKLLL